VGGQQFGKGLTEGWKKGAGGGGGSVVPQLDELGCGVK